jgi:predicted phage-related endonuclease
MRWGKLMEPVILAEYGQRTGQVVRYLAQDESLTHPKWPDVPMRCTPDGETDDGKLVEIKRSRDVSAWSESPPIWYQVQVQHQMSVMQRSQAAIVVLLNDELRWWDIERNDRFVELLELELTRWWAEYVVARVPPPESEVHQASVSALSTVADSGATILLPPEATEWDIRLRQIKLEEAALRKEKAALEDRLKVSIGEATIGTLPDGGMWTWKLQSRKSYQVEASSSRVLRRIK